MVRTLRPVIIFTLFITIITCNKTPEHESAVITNHDERPLLFVTLGGGMVALDQTTGHILWTHNDEPAVRVPNENEQVMPQFLPDPRYGSLYMFGTTRGGESQVLKKMPFTIPQLVANSPCRSSDGILYTGKKIDTWFLIDPKTGMRKQVLGFDKCHMSFGATGPETCPIDPQKAIYVARTEYNILMYDSKSNNKKWNVTYFDYSSHNMPQETSNDYGIVHFTSTSSGRIKSFNQKTGEMVWSHDMKSPIVAAYLLDRDGLISVPFNTVGDDTMDHIMEDVSSLRHSNGLKHSNIELFPSLYVGEHPHGLYAISSLVDKNTITISSDGVKPLLLEGPNDEHNPYNEKKPYRTNINVHYNFKDGDDQEMRGVLLYGHYSIPEYIDTNWKILTRNQLAITGDVIMDDQTRITNIKLIMGPKEESTEQNWFEIQNSSLILNKADNDIIQQGNSDKSTIDMQSNMDATTAILETSFDSLLIYKYIHLWFDQQDNKILKFALIIMAGLMFSMFWYFRNQIREFQHLSQGGSKNSSSSSGYYNSKVTAVAEELEDGTIKVGKIIFNPQKVLGKGCEGTFVYQGNFENRDVAVKRLLPECFTFADREVALLTESDTHSNVVRYFCTEQDRLFRYIALELCAATLQDYVQKDLQSVYNISPLELLHQATSGLAHLHSLNIVHRDIKPHNVLLSMPSDKSDVRAMISDFGLCKKLNIGRNSFSRRSGVTGTDGWIAPEMIKGERTTTSVDIFSLGCVFHYVLSKGVHPFGDVLERQAKILKGVYDLTAIDENMSVEDGPLALCILKAMLSPISSQRPTASVVYKYPLFWSKLKILTFFQDVSDRVEKDPPGGVLENGGVVVVRRDWRGHVCTEVAADLRKYRSYSGDSVRDLLRALRNKKHHYRELTKEAQTNLGNIPDGFTMYWLTRFPKLLLHTWLQMQHYKNEDIFLQYYDANFDFDRNYIIQQIDEEDLKKYELETNPEMNNLYIKSRNYYEPTKYKKYKNDDVKRNSYYYSTDANNDNPRTVEENDNHYSPQRANFNKYNKYDKKKKYFKSHTNENEMTPDKYTSADPVQVKVKQNKKQEEAPIRWILSNSVAPPNENS